MSVIEAKVNGEIISPENFGVLYQETPYPGGNEFSLLLEFQSKKVMERFLRACLNFI